MDQLTPAHIHEVLAADSPISAAEIVVKLKARGMNVNKEAVNKLLYAGPFEKAPGAGVKPVWQNRAAAIALERNQVLIEMPGVGSVALEVTLPDATVTAMLRALAMCAFEGARDIHIKGNGLAAARWFVDLATATNLFGTIASSNIGGDDDG